MKNAVLTLALFLVPVMASAQTWVEIRTYTAEGATTPRLDAWLSGSIADKLGSFGWLQADQTYAEAYAGLTFSPKNWLQFGAGAGIEQAPRPARFGSFLWAGNQRQSGLAIFEQGGSGPWWKAEYNYQLYAQLGVGLITERFKGSGIRLQVSLPKTPLTLWGAPLLHNGHLAGIVCFRMKM